MKKWRIRGCKAREEQLQEVAKAFNIPIIVAQILAVRGYITIEEVSGFLNTDIKSLPNSRLLRDMDKGCDLLLDAINTGKKIVVFGDYDADGITGTSILTLGLRRLGADVDYYIPQRETEGYGLNFQALKDLAAQGFQVLLTCDNGISAFEQIDLAVSLGMTVIVADHHEVSFEEINDINEVHLPNAMAIINPKQHNCEYPFKSLCGGTIAYKIIENMYRLMNKPWEDVKLEYLSLASVACVCDIMDMTQENRSILRYILPKLGETPNIGLRSLIEKCGLEGKELSVYHIGFVLGPCINACGRLEFANIAVDLFLSNDKAKADELATYLYDLNNSRKHLSNEGVDMVKEIILANKLEQNKVIVVHCKELHDSIAGIVSGRIKEMYNRPTFVLAGDKEIIRGSGRSIEEYNMFLALQEASDILEVFGGHPMAAGLSIRQERVGEFSDFLNEHCTLTLEDMISTTYIDLQFPVEKVSLHLANALKILEPSGKGNSTPRFGDKNLLLKRIQLLGSEENVVRMYFDSRFGKGNVSAINFRQKDALREMIIEASGERMWQDLLSGTGEGIALDIIYTITVNNYNGRSYPQIQIEDFRINNS